MASKHDEVFSMVFFKFGLKTNEAENQQNLKQLQAPVSFILDLHKSP